MAATQPVLAGGTLAHPYQFRVSEETWGADTVMADGSMATDLVDADTKHRFSLRWRAVTAAQKATIVTAFQAIKNTSGTLIAPDGGTHTVTRVENGKLESDMILGGDDNLYWNVSLDLRET